MRFCYNNYWGWPKPVADIYKKYGAMLDPENPLSGQDLLETLCHVVWSDENFDQWESTLKTWDVDPDYYCSVDQEKIAKQSLVELGALDPDVRDYVHPDYDGAQPENYPPEIEFVKPWAE